MNAAGVSSLEKGVLRIRRQSGEGTEKKDAAGANTGGVLSDVRYMGYKQFGLSVLHHLVDLFKSGIQVFGPGSAGLRHIRSSAAAAADKG